MDDEAELERQRAASWANLHDLVARGAVRKCFLISEMFGGTDDPRNVVWLPPASIQEKERFDERVREAVEQGEIVHYSARPLYDDLSHVPAQVVLAATGSHLDMHHIINVLPHKTWQ